MVIIIIFILIISHIINATIIIITHIVNAIIIITNILFRSCLRIQAT